MNMNLYEVSSEYLIACDDLFERSDDFSPEVIEDTLEGLAGNVEERAINVASYFQNLKKEAETMKEYEKKMKARREIVEDRANKLVQYIKKNMEMCGIKKIKGPEFELSIRKSPASIVVDDLILLPEECIKTTVSVNKSKIKELLKSGKNVQGVHLESGTTLTIK